MRKILFRGYSTASRKWFEGDLIHSPDIKHPCICNNESFVNVSKKTIGQYTGSVDKNGNKIFEGDIVEFYFFDKGHKNTKTMCIEWQDSGFCMRELFRDYRLADDFSVIDEKIFTYRGDRRNGVYTTNNTYFVEVIGNTHDNPELLRTPQND